APYCRPCGLVRSCPIASCLLLCVRSVAADNSYLLECLLQCRSQCSEIFRHVFAEMHSQRASSPLRQHCEITSSLSGLHDAKRVFLPGHGKVDRVVTSDLQKHAAVRPSFVCLTRRVQKARPETKNSRNNLFIANTVTNLLQCAFIGVIHGDVPE